MKTIDAKNLACPLPVIKAKKALMETDELQIIVDNQIATQNLKKLAEQMDCDYSVEKQNETDYLVQLTKRQNAQAATTEATTPLSSTDEYTVVINSDTLGKGEEPFSQNLLKMFIYTLTEQPILPKRVIFYNLGVQLVAYTSPVLEDLQHLANSGVEILACGACLDYYQLNDQVAVGQITNMYHIIEILRTDAKIIYP